ncbi:hypothetical protein MMC28_004274 [Mycoblastus sanguinarius]|nr:hypothetical protein [Mycoblastus sanguinarius]
MASTLNINPHRGTPTVQALQSTSPYTNFYTKNTVRPDNQPSTVTSHAHHPEWDYRFLGSAGYGGRHVNDKAPFSLWDDEKRTFLLPTAEQNAWIFTNYNATDLHVQHPFIIITTASPSQPIPLTVGCVAAIFVSSNTPPYLPMYGKANYANPRLPDPCPEVQWPKLSNPSRSHITQTLKALSKLMALKNVLFLVNHNVVELEHEDGRIYEPRSLPGIVGKRMTTYHHSSQPFLEAMQSLGRENAIHPREFTRYLPDDVVQPQDRTDYLANSGILTPGVRVSSESLTLSGTPSALSSQATTAGVILHNGAQTRLTVADHGFLTTSKVYHPDSVTGTMVGTIQQETFPELDVALVKPNPSSYLNNSMSNNLNFQAETPRRLVASNEIAQGDWYEVDGMSTGLISLLNIGVAARRPFGPLGFPPFDFSTFGISTVARIFGATNGTVREGVC